MKTDPRVKLLIIVLLTTAAVLAKDAAYLAIVTGIALIADLCFKVDVLNAFKRLKGFLWLLLFISIVQSLTVKGGTVLIAVGSVNLMTTRGIQFAIEFILRMSVIVFAGLIASSSDGREMTDGLLRLHMPYELAFMSGIALKYLPVYREEFSARLNALAMRGIEIKRLSLSRKLKVYSYLVAPTVTGCILRSEELARAMTARGFRAEKKRTMLRVLKMSAADWTLTVAALGAAAAFFACMYKYGVLVTF